MLHYYNLLCCRLMVLIKVNYLDLHALNHKFTRAQVRACALVGPGVDTPLYTIGMMLGRDTVCVPTKSAGKRNYLKQSLTS